MTRPSLVSLTILAGLSFSGMTSARDEVVWLVVTASDATPAGIARKAKDRVKEAPNGFTFQTADCGDRKNVFGWAAEVHSDRTQAEAALGKFRATTKDAYIKRCTPRNGSLLAYRTPAVDMSIADVPDSAVNWDDSDRVSKVIPLPAGRALIVAKTYVEDSEDPLEGRSERLMLAQAGQVKMLTDNCVDPAAAVVRNGRIALHCSREQAGDNILHTIVVFEPGGEKVAEVARCRNPRWSVDASSLSCDEESVTGDGKLHLRRKSVSLSPSRPSR